MELRGGSFKEQFRILHTLMRALPHPPALGQRRLRLAIMTDGAPSPGMNTAVRAAVRMAIDQGHIALAVENGFEGLINNEVKEFSWMDVHGWGGVGGSNLGISRNVPSGRDWYKIARNIEAQGIDGILVIGGWGAYDTAYKMYTQRETFPAFNMPIVCLPASINNNLPGSELSIGADTALNSIVEVLDKIKQSAVATRRCFVVEVMGRYCGYLALMSGLASGAERVYLNEDGVKLSDLADGPGAHERRLPTGQAPELADPQRDGQPVVYHQLYVFAVRRRKQRPVRRARCDPRPHAAGRQPLAVRPHPGYPPGHTLHHLLDR